MPPLAIMAGIGAAGSIAGGAISASGAGSAADTQANAAIQAANIQASEADKALQFQEKQYATGQGEMAPWLGAGTTALANLEQGMGLPVSGMATLPGAAPAPVTPPRGSRPGSAPAIGGRTFMPGAGPYNSRLAGLGADMGGRFNLSQMATPAAPAPAAAPGAVPTHQVPMSRLVSPGMQPGSLNFQMPQLNNTTDPGYLARLNLGTQAIENSAAARGNLLSGGEERALTDYAQNYASNEYNNVYNRALTNNMTAYNRLASMAGLGQETASGMVGAGQNSANSIANTLMSLGQLQGQAYNNAGAARAAGTVAGANAWGNMAGGLANYASMIPMMQMMQQQGNPLDLGGYGTMS